MNLLKASNHVNPTVLEEFQRASDRYREACRELTAARLAGDYPGASDYYALLYMKARKTFKLEARLYNEARSEFVAAVRAQARKEPTLSNHEVEQMYVQTNQKALYEEQRRQAILNSITPAEREALEKAQAIILAQKEQQDLSIIVTDQGDNLNNHYKTKNMFQRNRVKDEDDPMLDDYSLPRDNDAKQEDIGTIGDASEITDEEFEAFFKEKRRHE